MLTSLVAGLWLSRRRQARLPLTNQQRWGIAIGAFCGGMLGAKLPFALADPQGPVCLQAWIADGKTIMFGLVGGYLGVEVAKSLLEIRVKTGDSFAIPVAVSIAIGRLGCFVGGCCYGQPTDLPWAMTDAAGVRRHPTQLYEFLFHVTAALVLWGLERRGLFPRQRLKLYIAAYCIFRFLTEFLRPEIRLWGGLTGYQWTALALLPIMLILWWQDRRDVQTIAHGLG
ncbi:diacylglyceryl transferase [bacterium]|nr:diacylglyceryl transferase [bacterium]